MNKKIEIYNGDDYLKYQTWLETFKSAKNNGVVVFS